MKAEMMGAKRPMFNMFKLPLKVPGTRCNYRRDTTTVKSGRSLAGEANISTTLF